MNAGRTMPSSATEDPSHTSHLAGPLNGRRPGHCHGQAGGRAGSHAAPHPPVRGSSVPAGISAWQFRPQASPETASEVNLSSPVVPVGHFREGVRACRLPPRRGGCGPSQSTQAWRGQFSSSGEIDEAS